MQSPLLFMYLFYPPPVWEGQVGLGLGGGYCVCSMGNHVMEEEENPPSFFFFCYNVWMEYLIPLLPFSTFLQD